MAGSWIIDVHNLEKKFLDTYAVKNVSLQVKSGEIFGFLGANGSGKTTTIRMLCGLLTPDAGSGTCLGYDIIKESREIKNHVGYIPQFFGLYKQLTVRENLTFVAELYGIKNRKAKILEVMEQVRLMPYKNRVAGDLSGGWKQRLSLAAALLHEPLLLLLDEPTASVDLKSRRDFWEQMHALSREGTTILLSSHNMDEVERCDRLAYVSEGNLMMTGKINNIIDNVHLFTWHVRGANLPLLALQLQQLPGIEQIINFSDRLNVSGTDEKLLEQVLAPYMSHPNYSWEKSLTTLEDAFVFMSKKANSEEEI